MKMKREPEGRGGEVNSSKEMESKTSYFQNKNQIFDFKVQKCRGFTALWNEKNTDLVIVFRISNLKKIIEKVQISYLNFEN